MESKEEGVNQKAIRRREKTAMFFLTDQSDGTVIVTILDEDLRACEASMNGCHVQGALPFFALWRVK